MGGSRVLGSSRVGLLGLLALLGPAALLTAEEGSLPEGREGAQVVKLSGSGDRSAKTEAEAEHPLVPALRMAYAGYEHICSNVQDYTCTVVKRERIGGQLSAPEYVQAKVRYEQREGGRVVIPFSIYLRFLHPAKVKGREVLYVQGQNDDKMVARRGGPRFGFVTLSLDPDNELALQNSRHPVTEFGVKNLVKRLTEVAEESLMHDECEVKFFRDAKVNNRLCTGIHVVHPVRRDHYRFHEARIFIDDLQQVPIHYESYDWPEEEGGQPVLLEQYSYLNLKLNVGLSDSDFQRDNPEYGFR